MDILEKILITKRQEVSELKQNHSLAELQDKVKALEKTRGFTKALLAHRPAIIAEVKKASPSKGIICEQFDPVFIAKSYAEGGATCLSVLTDQQYFKGHNDYLTAIKNTVTLPILRKDFIIDAYQIYEARLIGADCILLITAALEEKSLIDLAQCAQDIGLDVLVEVHNETELKSALKVNTPIIGTNNRDLHTFKTDLNTTIQLLDQIPEDKCVISESGIHNAEDIAKLSAHDVHAYLIGEALMCTDNPGIGVEKLIKCYKTVTFTGDA